MVEFTAAIDVGLRNELFKLCISVQSLTSTARATHRASDFARLRASFQARASPLHGASTERPSP